MAHANELQRKRTKGTERTFTLDGKFFRDEAREAIRSYFMPFAGLYAAAVGKEVRVVGSDGRFVEGSARGASHPRAHRKATIKRDKRT